MQIKYQLWAGFQLVRNYLNVFYINFNNSVKRLLRRLGVILAIELNSY